MNENKIRKMPDANKEIFIRLRAPILSLNLPTNGAEIKAPVP